MKNIYIIRHGQTDFNKLGIVQGSGVDSDINETGINQSALFYKKYEHVQFDKIYISALKRTEQTVDKFINKGIPFEKCAELNEISWGIREGQAITAEEDLYYHNMINNWISGKTDMKIEGGESPDEVAARLLVFKRKLETDIGKNILICMHGRAMRIFLSVLFNYPLRYMDGFTHSNTSLYQLFYDGKYYRIVNFDDTKHLHDC
jgi:broad specificity phosphatase PhoE